MREFKDVIVELRKEKDMSQIEFAKYLQVSTSSVAMWETGKRKPTIIMIAFIAELFNVDSDYLLGKTMIRKKTEKNSVPSYDPDIMEIIDLYSKLSPEKKQTILNLLRAFASE